jgi:hypothetical protein
VTNHLLVIGALLLAPAPLIAQATKSAAVAPAKTAAVSEIDPAVITALRTAFAAQRAKGSYRALMDNSLGGIVLPSLEVEAVYPNRIRLKRSGMEIVFVNGKGMLRMGDKWERAPPSLAKSLGAIDDPQEDEKMLGTAILAKALGQTKVDDRTLDCYEVHTKGKNGVAKAKFFISLDDNLIRRVETRSEIQGKPLLSKMMVGDYGIPIQIELPK